jgi:hypothetical protein
LERCGYEHISFYVNRTRRDVPIASARQTLQPRQPTPAFTDSTSLDTAPAPMLV